MHVNYFVELFIDLLFTFFFVELFCSYQIIIIIMKFVRLSSLIRMFAFSSVYVIFSFPKE